HLVVEVVAFTGTLADTGKHGQTGMLGGDVVDQFQHVDGLADAGTAEQPDLATLGERAQQVDDLDAGFQQFLGAGLVFVAGGLALDRPLFVGFDRTTLVLRLAEYVHDAPQRGCAHRHRNRLAGIFGFDAARQAFSYTHGDTAYDAVTDLLFHFQHQVMFL